MDDPDDPFDLERFVAAQDAGGTYDRALQELRRGRKESHWMWFVFPQVAGLGQSPVSRKFAISSLEEARSYLGHGVLGPRLLEVAAVISEIEPSEIGARSAEQIFGFTDAQKLRSSMTLFLRAVPGETVFRKVLDRYFNGLPDPETDKRI
ncbi:MAG: DUF1810 domain-containing protein [Acidimicrobiales bacterium]|jgi:uncharacterized protein (DUF1810 family)